MYGNIPALSSFAHCTIMMDFYMDLNANTKNIVRLDPESGKIEVLYAGLEHIFVRGLSVSDGFPLLSSRIPLFVGDV